MRHLGFAAAACYRVRGENLVQVLATEAGPWPVAVGHSINYTATGTNVPPLGWTRPEDCGLERKHWPKAVYLYFPEQALNDRKFVLAAVNATGKRTRAGELHGPLEAVAARLAALARDDADREAMSETGVREHVRTLGIDLHMLLDHELRTPLASIAGYSSLLRELATPQPEFSAQWDDYWRIIDSQLNAALDAIGKLTLALPDAPPSQFAVALKDVTFDAADELRNLCSDAKVKATDVVGEEAARRTHVRFNKNTDQNCDLHARPELFRLAVWEVVKNAMIHARSGKVEVCVYTSDSMLVIDVTDDGAGVSLGSEDLIFLRFYQDPATHTSRKGKRGLGLGLFLARHVLERHLGQLTFIRSRSGTLFRFLWPLAASLSAGTKLPKGA